MARKHKQVWKPGDCFFVPLLDGSFLVGQVLSVEPFVLNSVACALFDQRADGKALPKPELGRLISTLFTTRDLLDSGDWKIFATFPVGVPREHRPFEELRELGFVGAKVIGSGIVNEFANAYCGLAPWDDWADPNYLDRLLLRPELKPRDLWYKTVR